jgi:hypothetical protein
MHQQLWGYKVEVKLYVGVSEQKRLNTAGLIDSFTYLTKIYQTHHFTSIQISYQLYRMIIITFILHINVHNTSYIICLFTV